jgi:hypothetical protein
MKGEKVYATVHTPYHRLKQNSTFKHGNGGFFNLEASAGVFIRRLSWNFDNN